MFFLLQASGPKKEWPQPNRDWGRSWNSTDTVASSSNTPNLHRENENTGMRKKKKNNLRFCFQTLLCRRSEKGKKKELTAWRRLNENLYTLKKTTTTRSLCMLRRQGIGFEISKCTTSLQAHAEQKQKKKKRSDGKRRRRARYEMLPQGEAGLKLLQAFKQTKMSEV